MEQFMKHFLDVLLHADPEDIVSSFDDDMEDDCEEEEEDSGDWDGDMPEFLERSTNVYRTRYYIVRQQIMYRRDSLLGAYLCSRDTFYCRTPERDRQYEAAFPHKQEKDGKRIPTLMYIRKYID